MNKILKEKWLAFSDEEKQMWKKWQEWDAKRYERDIKIYERKMRKSDEELVGAGNELEDNPPPKVKKEEIMEDDEKDAKGSFHIPKKKRTLY